MYDNFAKYCLNSDTEKDQAEQIHQMFNLDEKTALKVPVADTYNNLIRTNLDYVIYYLNI